MTLNIPTGIPAAGMLSVVYVPAGGIASIAAPKLSEITATGALNFSCYLMSDGYGQTADQAVTSKRRICSPSEYDILGAIKPTLQDMKYVFDVQNPASVSNKAYATLAPGLLGFLVVRWGKRGIDDIAVGDIVDVFSIRLGARSKGTPDDTGELIVTQKVSVVGSYIEDVAVVTG